MLPPQQNKIFNPDNLLKYVKGNPKRYNAIVEMISNIVTRGEAPLKEGEAAYNANRLDDARKIIHAMKGSMGNIGAFNVWNSAQRLESALEGRESEDFIMTSIKQVENDLKIMLVEANTWLKNNKTPNTSPKAELTDDAFNIEIDRLHILLSESNMQAFNVYGSLKGTISKKLSPSDYAKLDLSIQNLAFPEALKLLQDIKPKNRS